jgi:hypothetical protein
VRLIDPRTGRLRERNRILHDVTPEEARATRELLRRELEGVAREPSRKRVADFERYWLTLKKPLIDPGTYARYDAALEDHAFKTLGRIDLRELRTTEVQEWINREFRRGYRVSTLKGWYRVFRTMIQDAIDDLDLDRDPSRRVRFPIADEREERNALLPEQLAHFLAEAKCRRGRGRARSH